MAASHELARLSRRNFLQLGGALGLGVGAFALTGCAGPTGASSPGSLTLGLNRSLVSLDNKLNQFDAAVTVQRGVRQALTSIGNKLTPQLVLAERFDYTSPTRWTVRLRQGVRYSDGSPVAVEDVAMALKMYQQVTGSFLAAFFPEWPTVQKVDDRTFYLVTERPLPILDFLMANILITPAAANKPAELQSGVGSGPYVVVAANRGTGDYTLRANGKYWGPRPSIDTVRVRFMPEESSRVVALRTGEVDVIDTISSDSIAQLRGQPGVKMLSSDSVRINQLFFNFRKPASSPLSRPAVREALTYAIDGRSIVSDILDGSVRQADGVVPSILTGAVKTGEYAYDPAKSKQLLQAQGIGPGQLALKIIWETGEFASDTTIMEAVYQMLQQVGVKVTLQQFEPGGDISKWRQGRGGDWDVLGNGYPSPTGLALTIMKGMYAGTPEKEKTRDTYQGFVVPEITDLVTAASSEVDAKRRADLLATAQQKTWQLWPCLWAFVPKVVLASRSRVTGIDLGPTNSYDLAKTTLGG